MDKTYRLRDYGLAFLLYEHGLGVCGYELIRELFIFIKLILNSYLYFKTNHKQISYKMKKNRTIPLTLLLSALAATPAGASAVPGASASVLQTMQQQTSACKGVVKDTNGETLIGVSVVVKGTTNGTVTGLDGDFAINGVKKGSRLVVSFIGFTSQEVVWNGTPLNITLKEDNKTLDEVVVVGFGTQKKENLTGSVSQVKMSEVLGDRP